MANLGDDGGVADDGAAIVAVARGAAGAAAGRGVLVLVDVYKRQRESYNNEITDEFVEPFVCVDTLGAPVGLIKDDDAVICFNYRADRVRQVTRVLTRRSGLMADGGMSLPKAAELETEIPAASTPSGLHLSLIHI